MTTAKDDEAIIRDTWRRSRHYIAAALTNRTLGDRIHVALPPPIPLTLDALDEEFTVIKHATFWLERGHVDRDPAYRVIGQTNGKEVVVEQGEGRGPQ